MIVDIAIPPDTAEFVVAYEGPALAEHTIPVRDLAPALLALGQTLERVNTLVNGPSAAASLEIRATSVGSFEIGLVLRQVADVAGALFTSVPVSSAANITQLVLGVPQIGQSLVGFIKRLHGLMPVEVAHDENSVTFEVEGHVRLIVPNAVALAYADRGIRQDLEAMVRPLVKEGIDRMTFRSDDKEIESIEKGDVPSFREQGPLLGAVTQTVIPKQRLQIDSLNFREGSGKNKGKWRLTDGGPVYWYAISDTAFRDRVKSGVERFGSKDILICEVVMTQSLDADGRLRTEREITSVLAHETPTDQPTFFDLLKPTE